jgi:predicted nucleotidyltransferase
MIIDEMVAVLTNDLKAQAALLYGSYAQNLQDEHSDFDLLILLKEIPLPSERKGSYEKIPHIKIVKIAPKAVCESNGWDNSWSPINDKLLVHGKRMEIGYNTTRWVNRIVNNLIVKHKTTYKEFPFRPYTFLGLLEVCQVLYDRNHFIQKIQSKIKPILFNLQRLPPNFKKFILNVLPRFYEKQREISAFFEEAVQGIKKETSLLQKD